MGRAVWSLGLFIGLMGCTNVHFAQKFSLTPEKDEVAPLRVIDAPRQIINQKTCSGHVDDIALYSGKPDFQVGDAEITFVRLPKRLRFERNLAAVQEAIKSPGAITASVRLTGQLARAPERGDLHNQVVPLSRALRERLETELLNQDPATEIRIVCHGSTKRQAFATFCDGVVAASTPEVRAKTGDAFVAEMRTNFHSWTRATCVDEDRFCESQCDQRVDPLVLDTLGNGVAIGNVSGGVKFDINNIGVGQEMAWLRANTDDALLVRDLNGDGRITNGSELFGTSTVLSDEYYGAHGFKTLSDSDLNRDGVINASDAIFTKLQLWFDRNANGVSDAGELAPASDFIDSISLDFVTVQETDRNGNTIFAKSDVMMKGALTYSPRLIDIWFDARPLPSMLRR